MKLLYGLALGAMAMTSLAGCAALKDVQTTIATVADATIPANVALVAANSFDAIEATATNILIVCTPTASHAPPAVCASQRSSIKTMNASILAGRPIRNAIEPTASGQASPVSKTAYDKLQAIISTLTAAVSAFNAANSGN